MSAKVPLTDALSVMWIEHQRAERAPINSILRRQATLRTLSNAGTATREDVEAWWAARRDRSPALHLLRRLRETCRDLHRPTR